MPFRATNRRGKSMVTESILTAAATAFLTVQRRQCSQRCRKALCKARTKTGSGHLPINILDNSPPTRTFSAKGLTGSSTAPGSNHPSRSAKEMPQPTAGASPQDATLELGARSPRTALQTGYSAVPNPGNARSGNGAGEQAQNSNGRRRKTTPSTFPFISGIWLLDHSCSVLAAYNTSEIQFGLVAGYDQLP